MDLQDLFGKGGFNPADVVETNNDFSPLPAGEYTVAIQETELKPANSGNGTILVLKIGIIDGKYSKRILFENINVVNSSAKAQAIGQTALKQICESIGLSKLEKMSQLHDKPIIAYVDVELDKYKSERKGENVYKNVIKKYSKAPEGLAMPDGGLDSDLPF